MTKWSSDDDALDYRIEYIHGRMTDEEYFRRAIQEDEQYIRRGDEIEPGLSDETRGIILDVFREMARLHKSDEFWRHSNGLPVHSRLEDYLESQIARGIDVSENSWRLLVLEIVHGYSFGNTTLWRRVMDTSHFSISRLVRGAFVHESSNGQPTMHRLVELLGELAVVPEAKAYLASCEIEDDRMRKWFQALSDFLQADRSL